MSNENEERRYTPRFAKSAEELVFYTDTGQSDYPLYLTSGFEVRIKKKPDDVERFATFHVKSIRVLEECDADAYRKLAFYLPRGDKAVKLDDYVKAYPQLPLADLFKAINDVKATLYVKTLKVTYEIYKGDYEELISEADATVVVVYACPPYNDHAAENQKFAITHSTKKRLLSKLPPSIAMQIDKVSYIDKVFGRRVGTLPFIKIKFCLPSPELARAFDEVKKYLEGRDEVEVVEEAEGEERERAPQVEIELPEVKPQELELEPIAPVAVPTVQMPTAPTAVPTAVVTAPAPAKAELVKIYLLAMRLPSKYLVQDVEAKENVEIRKWEGVAADVASRLESIRRKCYAMIEKAFANVEDYGVWIAVSEEAVEEAKKVSEYVKKELSGLPQLRQVKDVEVEKLYSVRAVPIYMEPEDAKELLGAAVRHLSADVDELEARIKKAEEEQKKQALLRLQQSLEYKRALLDAFKRFLERLS